jgi:2-polyprenyl-3-methyl-5-hydroxy-6-metoxy-1,4-benzoquinol methylase
METTDKKNYWDRIYQSKQPHEVSWTQDIPRTSLAFLHHANLPKSASIIDIGAGDSRFVDFLLEEGFENITILDISEQALEKAKQRLGDKAKKIKWIISDVTEFQPTDSYDFWHDRASFHFLTTTSQIKKYLSLAKHAIKENGIITIGTFSTEGPKKCSGLDIKQYSEETLAAEFENGFKKTKCITENHTTPFNTTQHFLFCAFKRNN